MPWISSTTAFANTRILRIFIKHWSKLLEEQVVIAAAWDAGLRAGPGGITFYICGSKSVLPVYKQQERIHTSKKYGYCYKSVLFACFRYSILYRECT